jgi:hypothetical protein
MVPDTEPRSTKTPNEERRRGAGQFLVPLLVVFALGAALFLALPPSEPEDTDAVSEGTGAEDPAAMEQADYTAGQKRCEFFVVQKILSARQPTVLDHWEKDGKRVFEVGFTMSGEPGQSVRLCVYDPERGSALLPAVDDQGLWQRQR